MERDLKKTSLNKFEHDHIDRKSTTAPPYYTLY